MKVVSLGIDVGLAKGLHLVGLSNCGTLVYQDHLTPWDPEGFQARVFELAPQIVSIDAPSGWAAEGKRSRTAERALKKSFGIQSFYTPCHALALSGFYDWVRRGEELYDLLASRYPRYQDGQNPPFACEVFPNASAKLILRGEEDPALPSSAPRSRHPPSGAQKWTSQKKWAERKAALELILPGAQSLTSLDEIDAALASWTGLQILQGRHVTLGTDFEGHLFVPLGLSSEARVPLPYTET